MCDSLQLKKHYVTHLHIQYVVIRVCLLLDASFRSMHLKSCLSHWDLLNMARCQEQEIPSPLVHGKAVWPRWTLGRQHRPNDPWCHRHGQGHRHRRHRHHRHHCHIKTHMYEYTHMTSCNTYKYIYIYIVYMIIIITIIITCSVMLSWLMAPLNSLSLSRVGPAE